MGFDATQSPLPLVQGVPQATYSNPFTSANPLVAPPGKSYGANYGLGAANVAWANQNFKRLVNDRINLTLSRQLPAQIMAEVTMFLNFGRDVAYAYNLNQVDPRIVYAHPSQMDVSVANPFYQYLTPSQFPGPLRNNPTVAVKTLLAPYPQYGGLWEAYDNNGRERYRALQFKVQRPFAHGYNFLFGYNYRREMSTQYYDDVAAYLNKLSWQDSNNPRQSVSAAASYDFPVGKGRAYLQHLPRVAEGVLGGWHTTGAWYFNSGDYLRFGSYAALPNATNVVASGDPALTNPTPGEWFDITKFKILPAYTPRTNPLQYPDVRGPIYWEIQANLAKTFPITERVRAELKVAAYNLTNRLNRADLVVDITNSAFGTALREASNMTGRQMEFGLKILF